MAPRKAYPLRLDPVVHEALQRWADADLRSVNAQIEFLLRSALQQAGRLPGKPGAGASIAEIEEPPESGVESRLETDPKQQGGLS
jgi:hypothetical protein